MLHTVFTAVIYSIEVYCVSVVIICTMVYTIEMAAAQIEIHMNGIRSNSRTGSLLVRGV